MPVDRKQLIQALLSEARDFKLCSPSDDLDEITAVTSGYHYLVTQFKRLAGDILPPPAAKRLDELKVEVNDVYSAYEARAELEALFPDIEDALESMEEDIPGFHNKWIVALPLILRLEELSLGNANLTSLVLMCKEINSSYKHGNLLAAILLMRTVLNHVPPIFGYDTFEQVAANARKSLKDNFEHLEKGVRKVADFHAHRRLSDGDFYPSIEQIEPFKPQFDLLLRQVIERASNFPG